VDPMIQVLDQSHVVVRRQEESTTIKPRLL
jgi:hypothetical protein